MKRPLVEVERLGPWWRGGVMFTRGLWRVTLVQDFLSLQAAIRLGPGRAIGFNLLFWSVDFIRLTPVSFVMPIAPAPETMETMENFRKLMDEALGRR